MEAAPHRRAAISSAPSGAPRSQNSLSISVSCASSKQASGPCSLWGAWPGSSRGAWLAPRLLGESASPCALRRSTLYVLSCAPRRRSPVRCPPLCAYSWVHISCIGFLRQGLLWRCTRPLRRLRAGRPRAPHHVGVLDVGGQHRLAQALQPAGHVLVVFDDLDRDQRTLPAPLVHLAEAACRAAALPSAPRTASSAPLRLPRRLPQRLPGGTACWEAGRAARWPGAQ